MNPEYKNLWTVMNRLDEEISDIDVASKLLDACAEYISLSEQDKALNSLIEAKEYLKTKVKDAKKIVVKTEKPDSSEKYGRILGWIYLDGNDKSINEQMIEDGYAWVYMGKTKVKDFVALADKRKKSGK